MTYRPGQLVRILGELRDEPRASTVARVTDTLVVLRNGMRFRLRDARISGGVPGDTRRIEPWGEQHRRAS